MLRLLAVILLLSSVAGFAVRADAQEADAQGSASGPRPVPGSAASRSAVIQPDTPDSSDSSDSFGVSRIEITSERDRPQLCVSFSQALPPRRKGAPDLSRFVRLTPAPLFRGETALTVRDRELCLDGLDHGQRYTLSISAGLPAATGETLEAPVVREVEVRDRRPSLTFRGQGYILPRVGAEGLPLRSVNIDRARLQVIRIADRELVERIYWGRINQTLTDFEIGSLLEEKGEVVWRGEMAIGGERNRTQVTPFPIDAVMGALGPGVFVAVAENAALSVVAWDLKAVQWFVVSDIGLTSFQAENGLFLFARQMSSAAPMADVELRLLARDNSELARTRTGPDGLARFEPGLLTGTEGRTPQAVLATGPAGDFSLLEFSAPAMDLAGRNGSGRVAAGALDVWLWADHSQYRPGDHVQITALLRDADARSLRDRPLSLRLSRPDGLEVARQTVNDAGGGGYSADFALSAGSPPGRWQLTAHADPDGPVIGRTEFAVGEFLPPRFSLQLSPERPAIGVDGKVQVRLRTLSPGGVPPGNLPGEATVTVRPANPVIRGLDGYQFRPVHRQGSTDRRNLPGFTTDSAGVGSLTIDLGQQGTGQGPQEAVIHVTLYDVGGRRVDGEIVLPLEQPFLLGLKPNFTGDAVPEAATVAFSVVAVSPDGRRSARSGIAWELFEESHDYVWFEAEGRWDYRTSINERRLTGGSLSVSADVPAVIEEQVGAGRYRLEVYDPASGVSSSLRFSAGWWVSSGPGDAAETVEVVLKDQPHAPGGRASVFIRPPFEATVLVTVADRQVRHSLTRTIGPQGAFLDLPIDADLTGGAYVLATAYAPTTLQQRGRQRRAVGLGWLAVDRVSRQLSVGIDPLVTAIPGQPVSVPVTVKGLAAGETAYVRLLAVDAGLARAEAGPDPLGWYLGRRQLQVTLRDAFGRLLDSAGNGVSAATMATALASTEIRDESPDRSSLPAPTLTSAIVAVSADGQASVSLTPPAGNGHWRLLALAWSADRLGLGHGSLTAREPLAVSADLPAFLAPDDSVRVNLAVELADGPRGPYSVSLSTEGPLTLSAGPAEFKGTLAAAGPTNGPARRPLTAVRVLTATGSGPAALRLTVNGPQGFHQERILPVTLRSAEPPLSLMQRSELAPGADQTLALPDMESLRPGSARLGMLISPQAVIDLPGLLATLDSRTGGSAEQMAARLLALLALDDTTLPFIRSDKAALRVRIDGLIDRLSQRQRTDGAFALWSVDGPAEPWLTAFVLDVLTRARDAGYTVPDAGYRRGIDWLLRSISNAWVTDADLPARAYALYTAVRAKSVDAAPVRFLYDTQFDRMQNPLARAQLAATFALLGDGERAADAFGRITASPVSAPVERPTGGGINRDFGTDLRDRAAALALMADSGVTWDRLAVSAAALASTVLPAETLSLQERSWLLLAWRELAGRVGPMSLTAGTTGGNAGPGMPVDRALFRQLEPGASPVLRNTGDRPLQSLISAVGTPLTPPAAAAAGMTLTRRMLNQNGKPLDPARLRVGDPVVVVLEGRVEPGGSGPLQLVDPLPAGLVIENVRLGGNAPLGSLSWLGVLSEASHVEFREDRFVAALDSLPPDGAFRLVYLARIVSAGTFSQPAARIEDTVDPRRFARTAAGRLTVSARKPG